MAKVALILAGCGYLDGSEIQETVLTILALEQLGVQWQGLALNKNQTHIVNHTNQTVQKEQQRNMIEESARITRGNIIDIEEADTDDYDAIIFPGGFGVAKNIFNFALVGDDTYKIDETLLKFTRAFYLANKPAGFICISPLIVPLIYPKNTNITIGTDEDITNIVEKKGVKHIAKASMEICVDESSKVVTTPAYMNAKNIVEVQQGIYKLVEKVISFIN